MNVPSLETAGAFLDTASLAWYEVFARMREGKFRLQPSQKPRVKICCISSINEAQLAIQHGASALGLVSAMPSGPGVITEDLIAQIAPTIPPSVSSFLLTSNQDAGIIIAQQRRCGTNTIQIVDHFPIDGYKKLREPLPGISLVQVIHVRGEESIEEALSIAPYVNGILLDSGNPSLAIKELGGTGRTHDWTISQKIREAVDIPVFLAGGLNADNEIWLYRSTRLAHVPARMHVKIDAGHGYNRYIRYKCYN